MSIEMESATKNLLREQAKIKGKKNSIGFGLERKK